MSEDELKNLSRLPEEDDDDDEEEMETTETTNESSTQDSRCGNIFFAYY